MCIKYNLPMRKKNKAFMLKQLIVKKIFLYTETI